MSPSRREFIAGIVSIAAFPTAVNAQPAAATRRIGMLMIQNERDSEGQARVGIFRQSMADVGWVEGRNLQIDYRWGGGDPARAATAAAELLSLSPDLILATGTPPTAALQKATQTVPVIFVVVTDPVGAGFVESLANPGANITGFSTFEPEIGGKWLELLRELSPNLAHVAGVLDPAFTGFAGVWRSLEETATKAGISVSQIVFRTANDDLEGSLQSFAKRPRGGLIILPTAINSVARSRLFASAAKLHLPAIYPFRHYAADGGLMAYGFDPLDLYRRSAAYVDRILKGAKPSELPVQAPIKYELAINLVTAKGLGLTVPGTLLARADEAIE